MWTSSTSACCSWQLPSSSMRAFCSMPDSRTISPSALATFSMKPTCSAVSATPALTRSCERRSSARNRSSWRRNLSRSARTETNCPADSATRTRRAHSRSRSRSSSIAEYSGSRATREALARLLEVTPDSSRKIPRSLRTRPSSVTSPRNSDRTGQQARARS